MTIAQVLAAADARLTPETWTQHPSEDRRLGLIERECAYLAIDNATSNHMARRGAITLFAQVISGVLEPSNRECSTIFLWNDASTTTLADVHTAFAASIAIACQQEQSVREEVPCAG